MKVFIAAHGRDVLGVCASESGAVAVAAERMELCKEHNPGMTWVSCEVYGSRCAWRSVGGYSGVVCVFEEEVVE